MEDVKAVAEAVFAYGGTRIGDLVIREVPDVGQLAVQYVADPEGNIIELQKIKPTGHKTS